VIVTGGAGFIGSHLVERLLNDGKAVVVLDDFSTGRHVNLLAVKNHPRLRVIASRVSECDELAKLADEAESIYHLAAAVGVELVMKESIQSIRANLRETEAILEAASRSGVRILIASTSEVYGKSTREVFSEEDDLLIGPPHLARWSYACSKLMDEFLALAYAREQAVPVVIARLFNTVGPRQTGRYGMVLPRFIAAAKAGTPLRVFGDGQQTRCFCYVDDTVSALVRLQSSNATTGRVFNVGGIEEVSISELARLVIRVLESNSTVERIPYAKAYPAGFQDMERRRPSLRRIKETLQWEPRMALKAIIEKTAEALASE
jgi:UDP-glucose 4-epimerase